MIRGAAAGRLPLEQHVQLTHGFGATWTKSDVGEEPRMPLFSQEKAVVYPT